MEVNNTSYKWRIWFAVLLNANNGPGSQNSFNLQLPDPLPPDLTLADPNPNRLTSCYTPCQLLTLLCFSLSPSFYHLLLTFWHRQPSHLCSPVSCLIIEVSVCLQGAAQYLLIKALVCVCLFISDCYSRRSPRALMRRKPAIPTVTYTVSCHCTFSQSEAFLRKRCCLYFCGSASTYCFWIVSVWMFFLGLYDEKLFLFSRIALFPFFSLIYSCFFSLPCEAHMLCLAGFYTGLLLWPPPAQPFIPRGCQKESLWHQDDKISICDN